MFYHQIYQIYIVLSHKFWNIDIITGAYAPIEYKVASPLHVPQVAWYGYKDIHSMIIPPCSFQVPSLGALTMLRLMTNHKTGSILVFASKT